MTIHYAHRYKCPENWYWVPGDNNWTGLHLWLVIRGEGTVRKRNAGYELKPGACVLYRMDEDYRVDHNPENPLEIYGINFTDYREAESLPEYTFSPDYSLLASLMDRILKLYELGNDYGEDGVTLLKAALCEYRLHAQDFRSYGPYPDSRVNRFVEEVKRNPGERYTIGEISKIMSCSPNQCIRITAAETGQTPIQLVNQLKIEAARQHLMATSVPVKEIAEILGFCDEYYFSKVFKQITGFPPGHCRSRRR